MKDFYKHRDFVNLEKVDFILAELPEYVGYFLIGIAQRTSTLTRLNYAGDIKTFFTYLNRYKFKQTTMSDITLAEIDSILPIDIEKYLNYLESYYINGKHFSCGEKARERKLSSLRSFFKYLFVKDYISTNILTKVEMPKIHTKPIVKLDINEVVELLDTVETGANLTQRQESYNKITSARDLAIVSTFLGTGIRVSELVGLNKNDIDYENNSFVVTRKGGNKTILYLPEESLAAINEYLDWLDNEIYTESKFAKKITNHDALFLSLQGHRISVRAVELLIKKYSKLISPLKNITPHKLRSTFATNLYRETGDIYVVADVLGHSDVNTTRKHYAAMNEENKRNAAKVTVLREKKETQDI